MSMLRRISTTSIRCGDIIAVSSLKVDGVCIGFRPFLVWNQYKLNTITHIELLEISGKAKIGSDYPYNVPVRRSTINGLEKDSHIKADQLFICCENTLGTSVQKLGILERPLYPNEVRRVTHMAMDSKKYRMYDQSNNGMAIILE